MSKAEKESLLREGQKRFYLDGGGVTLVKSYVRQIEKYHCVYEESKVFQELEKQGKAVILKIDPEVLLNTEIRPKEKQSWDGLEKWLTEIGKSLP